MPIGGSKPAATPPSQQRSRRRQRNPAASSSVPAAPAASTRTSTVQAIYDISKDIFAAATPGFQPLPSDVARLSGFLNGLKLQDIGLDAAMPYVNSDLVGRSKVTYLHFADTDNFSFGVFCLPQSAAIPLHDHPGMTVFSKILLGSMHIKSYDWVKAPPAGTRATRTSNGARLAKLNTDAIFDASSETVVLYPEEGGNLHCFTATAPCVVLDVMGPPYRQTEGRDCSYFGAKVVRAGGDDGQYAWLKQVRRTLDLDTFHMRPIIRK